ncbi:hypothetical protein ACFL35_13890 [Candidatus Riflebacteria bacterium]
MPEKHTISDLILKNANLLFFGLNQKGIVTLTNNKCKLILGYDYEDIELHSFEEILYEIPDGGVEKFLLHSCKEPQFLSLKSKKGIPIKVLATTTYLEDSPTPHIYYISYLTVFPERILEVSQKRIDGHETQKIEERISAVQEQETIASEPEVAVLPTPITLESIVEKVPYQEKLDDTALPIVSAAPWFWMDKVNLLKLKPFLPFKFRLPRSTAGKEVSESGSEVDKGTVRVSEFDSISENALLFEHDNFVDSSPDGLSIDRALKDLKFYQKEGKNIFYKLFKHTVFVLEKANLMIGSKGQYLVNATKKINDPIGKELVQSVKAMFSSLRSIKRIQNSMQKVIFNEDTTKKISIAFSEMFTTIYSIYEKDLEMKKMKLVDDTEELLFIANEIEFRFIFNTLIELIMGFSRDLAEIQISSEKDRGIKQVLISSNHHFFEAKSTIFEQLLIDKKIDFCSASLLALSYGISVDYGIKDEKFFFKLSFPDY